MALGVRISITSPGRIRCRRTPMAILPNVRSMVDRPVSSVMVRGQLPHGHERLATQEDPYDRLLGGGDAIAEENVVLESQWLGARERGPGHRGVARECGDNAHAAGALSGGLRCDGRGQDGEQQRGQGESVQTSHRVRLASLHGLRGSAHAFASKELARLLPPGGRAETCGRSAKDGSYAATGAPGSASRDGRPTKNVGRRVESYKPLIVTFVVGPLTLSAAALGARLRAPRVPFLIAPVMLTLLASAPPERLTGRPPIVVQGQRPLLTETRFPPLPPKLISAPLTLRIDPPLRLTRGPFST